MIFNANNKDYDIIEGLRDTVKPGWKEMLNPAKPRIISIDPLKYLPMITKSEKALEDIGETLVGKNILEIGCGFGDRCFLMAKYEGTKVHGIDVDEYTVNQSPDINVWNPEDVEYIHNKIDSVRKQVSEKFPESVRNKVTFSTESIEQFIAVNPYDVIISFDVLEHLLDLDSAFRQMANSLKSGGILSHEYNSFFSFDGGHSLCTLDFHYGHCILSKEDFERYIKEIRPQEEKIAINFYNKCLNRATRKDIRELAEKYGLKIISEIKTSSYTAPEVAIRKELEKDILPNVVKLYPKVEVEDLLYNSIHLIMRKL